MVSLAFWSLPGSPVEVMYEMPPITTKMAATMPAIPITHWMPLMKSSSGVTHCCVAQLARLPEPFNMAKRIVFIMMFALMTMARPMKAWSKVFLPAATLLASPEENI